MNTRRRIQPPRSPENLKPPGQSADPNLFAEQTLLPTVGHPAVVCQLPGSMKLLYLFQNFNFPISDFRCALKVPIETQKIKHLSSAPKKLGGVSVLCVSGRFYGYTFPCVFSQQIDPPTRIAGSQSPAGRQSSLSNTPLSLFRTHWSPPVHSLILTNRLQSWLRTGTGTPGPRFGPDFSSWQEGWSFGASGVGFCSLPKWNTDFGKHVLWNRFVCSILDSV